MTTPIFTAAGGPREALAAACLAATLNKFGHRPTLFIHRVPSPLQLHLLAVADLICVDGPVGLAALGRRLAAFRTGLWLDPDSAALVDPRPVLALLEERPGWYPYIRDGENEGALPDAPEWGHIRGRRRRHHILPHVCGWHGAEAQYVLEQLQALWASTDRAAGKDHAVLSVLAAENPTVLRRPGLFRLEQRSYDDVARALFTPTAYGRGPFFASVRVWNDVPMALACVDRISPGPRGVYSSIGAPEIAA